MRISGALLAATLLAGALLTGCGGSADLHNRQAGVGPVGTEPAPGPASNPAPAPAGLVIADFADLAGKASCADKHNRLFIIDGKQVFWDRAGNCADMSYDQVLYGATPEDALCSHADSIAGPVTMCKDESVRALFDTIIQNSDSEDLGIGVSHTVEQVSLLAPSGTAVPFKVLEASKLSNIHEARNVVVKDAGAWASLWAEHAGAGAAGAPAVDFSASMVVGVFLGQRPSGCYGTSISAVTRGAAGIAVQHTDTVPGMGVMCAMYVTSPAALVLVDRSELPVEFTTKVVPDR